MKKTFLPILLAFVLCISSTTPALAVENTPTNDQSSLVFESSDFIGLSGTELGEAKLLASGHSQGFIDTMPDETLEKIALSSGGYQTESYMTEILTDTGIELVETTKDVFESELLEPKVFDTSNITVLDENGNVLVAPGTQASPASVTENVDGGTVYVLTSFYSVEDTSQPSHFLVVSEFLWSSMPDYRGTDFFGITRDSYVSIYPNSFGNYYAYEYDRYWYLATNTGVASTLLETVPVENTDLPNEDADNPTKGFAIEVAVPGDVNPPLSMYVGQNAYGYFCYALRGGCYFEGVVAQPSIVPTNFNIWTTYLHQDSTIWLNSPAISVPLGASITVSPSNRYADPVVDTILVTWGG